MGNASHYLRDLLNGRLWHRAMRRWGTDRGAIFTSIYKSNYWNPDGKGESVSGEGSEMAATENARKVIESIVKEFGIRSLLDAPCGDFHWMRHARLEGVAYTGADIVKELVTNNQREYGSSLRRFMHLDIVEQVCEPFDLILCRDCLIHLPNAEAARVIRNFSKSGSKYLLTTTFPRLAENRDLAKPGGFRGVNLLLPPFNLPKPEREWEDAMPSHQKSLGLWRLPLVVGA